MKQNLITDVVQGMLPYLNNAQTEKLQEVLQHTLFGYEVTKVENDTENLEQNLVELSILQESRSIGSARKFCLPMICGSIYITVTPRTVSLPAK